MTTSLAMICGECGRTVHAHHAPSFCPECRSKSGRFASLSPDISFVDGSIRARMNVAFYGEWTDAQRADLESAVRSKGL